MGQVRHGSATTTHAVRAAIQRSQASLAQLSRELGINPKTVAKWRKRSIVEDLKTGPSKPRSTVLTEAERECHELCVSGLAHAGFRYGHALKRSSNMIANWLRAANHCLTFLPPFSKLRIAR